MNRRSFLGLLAGEVLAKPVAKAGAAALKPAIAQPANTEDWWMPFAISDWACLQPGEIADALLFGGDQPQDFMVSGIGVRIASSTTIRDTNAILGGEILNDEYVTSGAWVELKRGALTLLEGPLWHISQAFGAPAMHPLPYLVRFNSELPFTARLHSSEPLKLSQPATVFMVLQGSVKMTPEQIERCRAAWEAEEAYPDIDTATVG